MKLTVFEKVKTIFEEFVKKGLTPVQPITKNLVEIVNLESTGVQAEVRCIFCDCNAINVHGLPKKHVVQYEVRGPNAHYWNYGNLKKHIKLHMKSTSRNDELVKYIHSLPVICDDHANESAENSVDSEGEREEDEHVQHAISSTSSTAQEQLYERFLAQKLSLAESNVMHNEQKWTMIFQREVNNRHGTVEVVKMSPDGNCLFAACIH